MEPKHVAVERDGGRLRLVLDGGPLTLASARELEHLADAVTDTGDVRVVTLAARGENFCPGLGADLDPLSSGVDPAAAIARIPVPVVAALRGAVGSVGLEIALAADIRIGQHDVTLSLADVDDGRLPCWGGTQRLPRLAGRSIAAAMILGGEVLTFDTARRCGLLQIVGDDADSVADDIARRLVELAPLALAAAKEALSKGPELTMRQALELEGDLNHLLQTTSDRAEGLAAFFEKRPPRFEGA